MSKTFMWAEIYRPKSLDECVLDFLPKDDKAMLQNIAATGESPNLLLYGSPGTGKTTVFRLLFAATLKYDIKEMVAENLKGHKNQAWLAQWYDEGVGIGDPANGSRARGVRTKKVAFVDGFDLSPRNLQTLFCRRPDTPGNDPTLVFTSSDLRNMGDYLKHGFHQLRFGSATHSDRDAHYAALLSRCQFILDVEKVPRVSDDKLLEIIYLEYPDVRQIITELQRRYQVQARRRLPEEHYLDYGTSQEFENPEEFESYIAAAIDKELIRNGPPQRIKHFYKGPYLYGEPVSQEEYDAYQRLPLRERLEADKKHKKNLIAARKQKAATKQEAGTQRARPSNGGRQPT